FSIQKQVKKQDNLYFYAEVMELA
ncbi:MAG: hypothetical protein PWP56_2508, partial [Acetobacterium sp.]|nr:hypothetical protein [Acetobacterium sp.]